MKWVAEKEARKSVEEMKMTMDIELNWLPSEQPRDMYMEQVGVPATSTVIEKTGLVVRGR